MKRGDSLAQQINQHLLIVMAKSFDISNGETKGMEMASERMIRIVFLSGHIDDLTV